MTAIPSQSIGPITRPPISGSSQHPAPPSQNKDANSPPRTREIAPPKTGRRRSRVGMQASARQTRHVGGQMRQHEAPRGREQKPRGRARPPASGRETAPGGSPVEAVAPTGFAGRSGPWPGAGSVQGGGQWDGKR
ncbi:hypothetical protein POSPLADRAFT_1059297 [Postia placenta MAD-698-R-SB12]|uniref:Uncharacterized protein n=1 Tax=Postia placenta MAD-698-R-SB12 TaxID=670580 RepID=A0A1X6MUD9_9APHY|nr:hypothetical protein POSPLADRAFT_1059297 [Postia placenta MAD-698-R-SB12]OSX60004.1 hypothetical protein POSPLADRAFT_1059297 [Postia placenta MAD-698-R-SB12]